MTFRWNNSSLPRFAVLISAILLGIVVGAAVLPEEPLRHLRTIFGSGEARLAIAMVPLAFVFFAIAILENVMDKRFRLEQDLLGAFLEHIPDNVFFKDLQGRFLRVSSSMAKYFGLKSPAHALGKSDADFFSSEHANQALEDEKEIIRTGRPMTGKEEKETWPDGRETWALTTKVPLIDRGGRIIGTMGISRDVTDRKQAELQISYMALHDALTGLPNRLLLEDRLTHAIASAKRNSGKIAVLMMDIDRFKNLIDSLGYYIGDRLLEAVAARLKTCTRASDTIARLGGDEFVIIIPDTAGHEDIEHVVMKLLRKIAEPIQVGEHELQVTASVGIAQFPENGESAETLLQYSDAALYDAKKKGRGRFCFFSPALTEATQKRHKLESDLQLAFSRDEFVVHYQPIVDTNSGSITGVEVLLRWKHPTIGLIPPDQFIPQLEELGLMVEVGRWVLKTACRQMVEWERQGFTSIRVAVNVSSQQIYEGAIVETVKSVLRETGLDPKLLELELTESRMLDDSEATIAIMRHLKQTGVSLSLDDFGTGWSSLAYLRRFPIDRIKIDRSFVRDLATQSTAEAMVKSILGLARNLGFTCIAEGVETAQQRDFLRSQRCAEMQGFFFSRPVTALDITALLCSPKPSVSQQQGGRGALFGEAPLPVPAAQTAVRTPAEKQKYVY
jgi:diguanylate cyclase (GGDEF)-like protein/PAS domain S-box-containing protein